MGAWYKPTELGKRTAIFACSAQVASLFSGSLQGELSRPRRGEAHILTPSRPPAAALYKNLNGVHGIKGWQYQFLVTGAASASSPSRPSCAPSLTRAAPLAAIPVALLGLFLFPDTPAKTRSRMFSPEERALAVSRLGPREATKLDRTLFRRVFARWEVWLMSLIWCVPPFSLLLGRCGRRRRKRMAR